MFAAQDQHLNVYSNSGEEQKPQQSSKKKIEDKEKEDLMSTWMESCRKLIKTN